MTSSSFPVGFGVSAVTPSASNIILTLLHLAHHARIPVSFLFRVEGQVASLITNLLHQSQSSFRRIRTILYAHARLSRVLSFVALDRDTF